MKRISNISGFTLVEVMAAIAILGIGLVTIILISNSAKSQAYIARNLKAARNLATYLMGEIEAGRIENPFDGMAGDFSSEGYELFQYEIGIGDDSLISTGEQDLRSDEEIRRDDLKRLESQREALAESTEEVDLTQGAEYEKVIVRVTYPTPTEKPAALVLIKKVSKEILEGKFERWETATQSQGNSDANN